jgi:hypothetical protein
VNNLAARFSSLKQSQRIRAIGIVVLLLGVAGACLYYWIQVRSADLTIEDLSPEYARAQQREIGIMMGHFGVMMFGWAQALAYPGTKAIGIAGGSAIAALGCFRVARLMDEDEQEAARQGNDR